MLIILDEISRGSKVLGSIEGASDFGDSIEAILLAMSPIRVVEILVMPREPSAGTGFGRIRRSPSVRGHQHVR